MSRRRSGDWPNNLLAGGQHVAAPAAVGWRRAVLGMVGAGVAAGLVGAVLIALLLTPAAPVALAAVPLPTPAPVATPLPDLAPAEVSIVRTTESSYASQPGDSIPISYRTPRIMEAGTVLVQLTGVEAGYPQEPIAHGRQVVRFELVDALTGDTLGVADAAREEGVNSDPVTLATLTEPRATYLRVASQVWGEMDGRATWHTWRALLQFDTAG